MGIPPTPVQVHIQKPLAPSATSVKYVANDKDDNEMILDDVQKSPGIYLTVEENSRKPQLGDRQMKGLCDQLSPQMMSVRSHSTS